MAAALGGRRQRVAGLLPWRVAVLRIFRKLPWDVHAVMRQIATRNGVTIVIRQPSVSLAAVRTVYRDTVESLPDIIAAHGPRSGVITARAPSAPEPPVPVAA